MKKVTLLLLLSILFCSASLTGMENGITLRFSANHTCAYAQLDSIFIENLTEETSKVLYYPDTTLSYIPTNIELIGSGQSGFYLSQNFPNPFSEKTNIEVGVPERGLFEFGIYDLTGRRLAGYTKTLEQGVHLFTFFACSQPGYIFNVYSKNYQQSQIMIHTGHGVRSTPEITYMGETVGSKSGNASNDNDFFFGPGDDLRFTGFAMGDYAVIEDNPETDNDYLFDIAGEEPGQPSPITGEQTVLANETGLIYEVDAVEGVVYDWTLPEGWEIVDGQGDNSITVNAGDTSGDISVSAMNACGTSPQRDLTVTVHFVLALEANPQEGGEVQGEGEFESGEEVSVTAVPNDGYAFLNWTDAGGNELSSQAVYTFDMPQENLSLTAHFEEESGHDHEDGELGEGVTDIDGNFYETVYIGDQEWMTENLRVSKYNNGDPIPTGLSNNDWSNATEGAYAVYPHDIIDGIDSETEMIEAYGKLYNWWAVDDDRNVCPDGWRVPSGDDVSQMVDHLINQYQYIDVDSVALYLRSCRQIGSTQGDDCNTTQHPRWNENVNNDIEGYDEFRFGALPGGMRLKSNGNFQHLGHQGRFWTSDLFYGDPLWVADNFVFFMGAGEVYINAAQIETGQSIRCVRDIE